MRHVRILHDGEARHARLIDDDVAQLLMGPPWQGAQESEQRVPVDALLPPVSPSKIVCVGKNYRAHAAELGGKVPTEPLLFLKAPSALLPPGGTIELPAQSQHVDHEGELGVVIAHSLKDATPAEAIRGIFGYTCVNDVTARDLQRKDVQFTRAKGFDTFCPCGPWIRTGMDPEDLRIQVKVNGHTRQDGRTSDMVWNVGSLLSFISSVMTLYPGDLVATGTPEGVGRLEPGDRVEVQVEGIGCLLNTVGRRSA